MDRRILPVSATPKSMTVIWNDGDGFPHQEVITCYEMRGLAVRARRKIAKGGGAIPLSEDHKKWAEELRKWHAALVSNA